LRAALAGAEPSPEQMFSFRMEPAFAQRPMMIVLYLIGLSIVILLVHKTYTGYYRKQRRKLVEENDKNMRLRQLTMEQEYAVERNRYLQEEFERKKKELAQTLIHLNKNIELLAEAKDHLALLPGETHRVLLQKIEANLSDEDSWNLLQTAFLQVDSGFMERLRNLNADLSPSDLKFCVYLRLNLSGKEIAALLNISAKSVEIKRYRLRKKLGLGQQVSLQQFILSL
jgi:DNA-binding CsgD family transcriptional regulator